jgi:hypothetical protein
MKSFQIRLSHVTQIQGCYFNPLKAELNPICHLLALLGGATIVVVSRLMPTDYQSGTNVTVKE